MTDVRLRRRPSAQGMLAGSALCYLSRVLARLDGDGCHGLCDANAAGRADDMLDRGQVEGAAVLRRIKKAMRKCRRSTLTLALIEM